MRPNRDDYSCCDWRATKSDILRSKKAVAKRRKLRVSTVLGAVLLLVVIVITLDGIVSLYT